MNWALSYFQKSGEIARLPIHEVIFEREDVASIFRGDKEMLLRASPWGRSNVIHLRIASVFLSWRQTRPDRTGRDRRRRKKRKKRKRKGQVELSYGTFVSSRSAMYLRSARSFSRAVTLLRRLSASSYSIANQKNII